MLRLILSAAMVASAMAFAPMGGVLPRAKAARGATGAFVKISDSLQAICVLGIIASAAGQEAVLATNM
jgi:hypothetical protein